MTELERREDQREPDYRGETGDVWEESGRVSNAEGPDPGSVVGGLPGVVSVGFQDKGRVWRKVRVRRGLTEDGGGDVETPGNLNARVFNSKTIKGFSD